jgi:LacI family transcriptional regulator
VIIALAVSASRWIREEAQVRGWRLMNLLQSDEAFPRDVSPRGALVNYLPGSDAVAEMEDLGCAVVRLGKLPHPNDAMLPAVLPDWAAEGVLAADHFHEREFRHVAFYGSEPWGDGEVLFAALNKRAAELNMVCHLGQFRFGKEQGKTNRAERRRAEFVDWIRQLPKPIGLLVAGSHRAATQCNWVERAGLSIPSDVAVLCAGTDAAVFESSIPTISNIARDDERQERTACDLLARLMAGERAPLKPLMIPPKGIIERESTDVLATPDRLVADVLRYMWNNIDVDLSVDQIADIAGIKSRQLSSRFRQALGRTVTQELLRKRLEEMKVLLRNTDTPVSEAAARVGFNSIHYMNRKFRAAVGMSPREYRKKHR